MIRKGRSASSTAGAGRSTGGPRDDDAFESSSRSSSSPSVSRSASFSNDSSSDSSSDSFDPFESFDAHDRAAGLTPASRERPDADAGSVEVTYTRSRRQPGEGKPGKPADTATRASQRPARSLKGRALGYLSRREYSRAELSRKLSPYAEEGESIDALLDSLESEGWLSDSRFAESLLNRRASRMGAGRIVNELKRHSVGQELVEEVSAQLRGTELARAQAVWRKKFGTLPETPSERAKQARFLATRGFSQGIIGKILKGIDEEWSSE